MVLEVTDSNISEVMNTDKIIVLDFWAEWCGPCRAYSPIIESFRAENAGIVVGKVNVDEVPELSAKYGIRGIPTTIILRDGEVINRVSEE